MRYYIVSWDCNGVEFFEEITEHHPDNWAKQHLFDSIKESRKVEKGFSFNLGALKMRAQVNTHRHYEIYVFTSNPDIGPDDIAAWFKTDPQSFADWVRKNHSYKIHDDRRSPYEKPAIV
jgi:hypothetical protein